MTFGMTSELILRTIAGHFRRNRRRLDSFEQISRPDIEVTNGTQTAATIRVLYRSVDFTIRGQRVILDADLARLYGVTTKALNQAVNRNEHRFPDDFVFQLKATEVENLRSSDRDQNAQTLVVASDAPNWSQFVTSSSRHRGAAYRPWVFTEHGVLMAANVVRSERAVQMSVFVVRAFVRLREHIAANQAILNVLPRLIARC
jgi:ORF6N domain